MKQKSYYMDVKDVCNSTIQRVRSFLSCKLNVDFLIEIINLAVYNREHIVLIVNEVCNVLIHLFL